MFSTDTWLRIIVSMQLNAVLFGAGAITVLSVPALAERAALLLPLVVVASFGLAPFLSKAFFPRHQQHSVIEILEAKPNGHRYGTDQWHSDITFSGNPPTALATTGHRAAYASGTTRDQASLIDGTSTASAAYRAS